MNLKKQLFTAFLSVALMPLIVICIYMFVTNIMLALNLHEQNLLNSTEIQSDLLEENLNRLMVRAKQFSSSQSVRRACKEGIILEGELSGELGSEILNFTDETLDNVSIFALLDNQGNFLFASGSNSDSIALKSNLSTEDHGDSQFIAEIPVGSKKSSLVINTPVQYDEEIVGRFLVVCSTDYLLKIISSHKQLESSNAFIYCLLHQEVITSKHNFSDKLTMLGKEMGDLEQGSLFYKLDKNQSLVYFSKLSKTPWVLVSTISTETIFAQVWSYGFINIMAISAVLLIIVFLSHRQSKKVLRPMDELLKAVEKFFIAGAARFPETNIDPKSEIGYLAEKFSGLSDEIAMAQGKLKESNYLYSALLKATFEFRIVINLQDNSVQCSSEILAERIENVPGEFASKRVMNIIALAENEIQKDDDLLSRIVFGHITEPMETEVHFSITGNEEKLWYRVVAVPVLENQIVWQVVLHFEDISLQKLEELRLIQSSQTDSLSGLYNKTAFPLHCKMSMDGRTDAMFFIDLDKFKLVNDKLGHNAGDEVLVTTSKTIQHQFRKGDVVGRFGGDEFVVFAPGISAEIAEQRARRLLEGISFHLTAPDGEQIHVTASVGICMAKPPVTLEEAIAFADEAMYRAKKSGRARYEIVKY